MYWLVVWRILFAYLLQTFGPLPRLKFWIRSGCVCQVNPNKFPKVCQVDSRCGWFAVANVVFGVALAFAVAFALTLLPLHLLLLLRLLSFSFSFSCSCSFPFSFLFPYWRQNLAPSKPSWNSVLYYTAVPNQVFLTHRLNQISRTVVVCNFHHPWRRNGFASGIKWQVPPPYINHPCSSLIDCGKSIIAGGASMHGSILQQAMGVPNSSLSPWRQESGCALEGKQKVQALHQDHPNEQQTCYCLGPAKDARFEIRMSLQPLYLRFFESHTCKSCTTVALYHT